MASKTLSVVQQRTKYFTPHDIDAADSADRLSFTHRTKSADGGKGPIIWWKPEILKTEYSQAHRMVGRTYGFEFLDYIHAKKHVDDGPSSHELVYIVEQMRRDNDWRNDAVVSGFFEVISEYLITGQVDR